MGRSSNSCATRHSRATPLDPGEALSDERRREPVAVRSPAHRSQLLHDEPARLPAARGTVSAALIALLKRNPGAPLDDLDLQWRGDPSQILVDDDLQLALWLSYELHYRGLTGVDEDWENHPDLIRIRRRWEVQFVTALLREVAARFAEDGGHVIAPERLTVALAELADMQAGPSMSAWLMKEANRREFAEFVIHRSIYHLKEADPHSWAIPRLSGAVKAAMVTIQIDEYGLGRTTAMHAQLFRRLMLDWELDAGYGAYLDQVPGVTLLATNMISLFGLHRRWRGALVGHLALFEMTSSTPNARYARGHRRLGGSEDAARFFDEHVVADAVHEQIASHQLAAGLARSEPARSGDILFGARCAALADQLFSQHVLRRWAGGRSSLITPMSPAR